MKEKYITKVIKTTTVIAHVVDCTADNAELTFFHFNISGESHDLKSLLKYAKRHYEKPNYTIYKVEVAGVTPLKYKMSLTDFLSHATLVEE